MRHSLSLESKLRVQRTQQHEKHRIPDNDIRRKPLWKFISFIIVQCFCSRRALLPSSSGTERAVDVKKTTKTTTTRILIRPIMQIKAQILFFLLLCALSYLNPFVGEVIHPCVIFYGRKFN